MRKYICDCCQKEMDFDSVRVEFSLFNGKDSYAYKHLCPACKEKFIAILNEFIPNFMDNSVTG